MSVNIAFITYAAEDAFLKDRCIITHWKHQITSVFTCSIRRNIFILCLPQGSWGDSSIPQDDWGLMENVSFATFGDTSTFSVDITGMLAMVDWR